MSHDEAHLAAYIAGDLSGAEEEAFDLHVLHCAACSHAVDEDRRGHRLVASLRTPLADDERSRLYAALGDGRPSSATNGRRLLLAVAVLVVVAGVGFSSLSRWSRQESPTALPSSTPIAVVADLTAGSTETAAVTVETVTIDGMAVVVARSTAAFAMPANSRPAEDGSADAWVIQQDGVNVVCVNGNRPLLVASLLEPRRLLDLIAEGELR